MNNYQDCLMYDQHGYRMDDHLTVVFRDRLNHSTGEYIKDNNMWSMEEYDEWQSHEFDRGKYLEQESTCY